MIITPGREALPKFGGNVAASLESWFEAQPIADEDVTSARPDQDDLRSETAFPLIEFYLSAMYGAPANLLDYAPADALVIVEDWIELADVTADLEAQALSQRAEKLASGQLPPDAPLPYITWDDMHKSIARTRDAASGRLGNSRRRRRRDGSYRARSVIYSSRSGATAANCVPSWKAPTP